MSRMRVSMVIPAGAVAVGLALTIAVPGAGASSVASSSSSSSAGSRSFHGKVTSVSTANRTFRIRRTNGASLTFRVTSATKFERLSRSLSSLRGKAIEVEGRKVNGRWVAREVEPDDDRGGDDHDDADDDHGSGGHGSDD